MTRTESDREDLIREAVALSPRAELLTPGCDRPVTVGFRDKTALSLFFGQDPVYQFDQAGRLRRAFVDGLLYRSQRSTLAQLERVRTAERTFLSRIDLTETRLNQFRAAMTERITNLLDTLQAGGCTIQRKQPADAEITPLLLASLRQITACDRWIAEPANAAR